MDDGAVEHSGSGHARSAGRGALRRPPWLRPALLVAAVAVVRWLSLTCPIDRGLGPSPQTGPAAPQAASPTAGERRSGECWGFGHHRWLARVGPTGTCPQPCDRPRREPLPGEGTSRPEGKLAPGTILPVHTEPSVGGVPPRWARVEDLHLIDADSPAGAPDVTDGLLLKGLGRWSPGGVLVPLSDLRPVVLSDLGRSGQGPVKLTEFTRGLLSGVRVWEYGHQDRPVVVALYEAPDPELPVRELQLSAYQTQPDGSMKWLASRYMLGHPLSEAAVSLRPSGTARDGIPDIVAFVPPLGPVCWRWDGERYRRALPTASEATTLVGMTLAGLGGTVALAACLLVLALGGWRLSPETQARPRASRALAISASLWVWEPLAALCLLLPTVGVLWWVGVRPALTSRRGPAWVLAPIACPLVFVVSVIACRSVGWA